MDTDAGLGLVMSLGDAVGKIGLANGNRELVGYLIDEPAADGQYGLAWMTLE